MTFQGHSIFTSADGDWRVAVITKGDQIAVTDPTQYTNEATATLAAKKAHFDKPFLNYVAIKA